MSPPRIRNQVASFSPDDDSSPPTKINADKVRFSASSTVVISLIIFVVMAVTAWVDLKADVAKAKADTATNIDSIKEIRTDVREIRAVQQSQREEQLLQRQLLLQIEKQTK